MKRLYFWGAALLIVCLLLTGAFLPKAHADEVAAQDLHAGTTISGTGYSSFSFLLDDSTTKYQTSSGNAEITVENSKGMASLYLLFHAEYGSYNITDNATGASATAGTYGFLHEFVDLSALFGHCPTSVTLHFVTGQVKLSEIYVFSEGTLPDFVQVWQPPLEGGADLMLMATHGDDDQLFFAGLLPYYAGQLDCRVQVVYLTDHRSGYVDNARMHEMLNGLWAVGVEAYPVFGRFADFRIDSLSDTYSAYQHSYKTSKDDLLRFVVEQIRRFRPQVIVGHDLKGEYGHGMHMVYADLLVQALDLTNDPTAFPASAESYGTWDVPKTYLHLYEQNPIVLDYDQPLAYFDGLTAFQATQKLGYPCHKSQQYTWFTRWINGNNGEITKATEIATYNPCHFGLYRSTVGEDVAKNDFLENITTYARQEQMDREAAEAVSGMIGALGDITLQSADAISAARAAYEALTPVQKALVDNLPVLSAAEEEYARLVREQAEKEESDLAAAQAVTDLINALPDPLTEAALQEATDGYNALTQEQKALVANYSKLQQAQAQWQAMQDEAEQQRLEQERLDAQAAQQREELKKLVIIVAGLTVLLIILLCVLRKKRKHHTRRKKR